jgi:hypothetical protein
VDGGGGMANWTNGDITLYHGCTDQSLQPMLSTGILTDSIHHGIDLAQGASRAEFGQGFYSSTWLDQAKFWANRQARRLRSRSHKISARAVVLSFAANRNELAKLQSLVFTNENADFWPFVKYCRSGNLPHGRHPWPSNSYDVVFGPVSIWPQLMVIKDADQVSFHTAEALKVVKSLQIVASGNPYLV